MRRRILGSILIAVGCTVLVFGVPMAIASRKLVGDHIQSDSLFALLIGLAIVSLLVGTVTGLILARRLSRPLFDVADRAARLGAGDFRTFPDRYRIGELDRVADVLDASATDIAALLGRERELVADISHQLRTRLTGLRLGLEELSLSVDVPGGEAATEYQAEIAEGVSTALDQTDQLVAVIDELLANARSRSAVGAQEIDLGAEMHDLGAQWGKRLRVEGRTLTVNAPSSITVWATPFRLREALGVLLDNALQHGSGAVTVTARAAETSVLVEVRDEGDGVSEALVGHIFDRGISTTASNGIGLDLARAFVEADGGRLELRQASPPVFGMYLARVPAPPKVPAQHWAQSPEYSGPERASPLP